MKVLLNMMSMMVNTKSPRCHQETRWGLGKTQVLFFFKKDTLLVKLKMMDLGEIVP